MPNPAVDLQHHGKQEVEQKLQVLFLFLVICLRSRQVCSRRYLLLDQIEVEKEQEGPFLTSWRFWFSSIRTYKFSTQNLYYLLPNLQSQKQMNEYRCYRDWE